VGLLDHIDPHSIAEKDQAAQAARAEREHAEMVERVRMKTDFESFCQVDIPRLIQEFIAKAAAARPPLMLGDTGSKKRVWLFYIHEGDVNEGLPDIRYFVDPDGRVYALERRSTSGRNKYPWALTQMSSRALEDLLAFDLRPWMNANRDIGMPDRQARLDEVVAIVTRCLETPPVDW
jgi:hypothetical protein